MRDDLSGYAQIVIGIDTRADERGTPLEAVAGK